MLFRAATRALLFFGLVGASAAATAPSDDESGRVVIVANADDADSLALARRYAAARAIPPGNIVALPLPAAETIAWPEFTEKVFNPLFRRLAADGWIDARPGDLLDAEGRCRAPIAGHRIAYLVLIRGVPLRIAHNPAWQTSPPAPGAHGSTIATEASVDSELALLAIDAPKPAKAFLKNPLYQLRTARTPLANAVVRVTRLDGPTRAAVEAMIDRTLAAEATGLAGRAYFDLGGPHADGDKWLETALARTAQSGFEIAAERTPRTFTPLARFDAPALYLGWYDWSASGPFAAPGFRFPAGAIAVHIHSFSAQTLRSETDNWCGPLVAHGVSATLGNVWEPYLHFSHHLDLFFEALLDGRSFGEAAYFSLPSLSWQSIALGDPLYRPFLRTPEEQLAAGSRLPAELRPYVALRQAHLALRAGKKSEAVALARAAFRETPSVPLAASVARLALDADDRETARTTLGVLEHLPRFAAADAGAVLECAALLSLAGDTPAAQRALAKLVSHRPNEVDEATLLDAALPVAREGKFTALAAEWETRLAILRPPPVPKP